MPNKEDELKNKAADKAATGSDKVTSDRHANVNNVLNKHGYKVLESVGKGSFADVRMAFSTTQKKTIAVKIISKDKITDKEFIRKFIPREIRVLRQLNHPNIIKFYKSIETVKTIFIFMELAENGDLLQVIKKEKRIDEKRACRWFRHLVDGVAHLHSRGVTHRDIKCENLLLDKYYVIKITDFGFTRDGLPVYLLDGKVENKNRDKVMSSTFCGSFAYASPEVLKGIPYEPNMSDVWSMGVVLYIMVYGRLPFDDTNWNGLVKQVSEPVGFPPTPELSDSLKSFIQDILSPLSIRIYIPEIRINPWYTKTWDSQLEKAYQRKHRWEAEEKITSKTPDQAAYKGKVKDITRYERAATLRRYISEKERLVALKRQIKEDEVKLEEMKNDASALRNAIKKDTEPSEHLEDQKLFSDKRDATQSEKDKVITNELKDVPVPLFSKDHQMEQKEQKEQNENIPSSEKFSDKKQLPEIPKGIKDIEIESPFIVPESEKIFSVGRLRSILPLSEVDPLISINIVAENTNEAKCNEEQTNFGENVVSDVPAVVSQPHSDRHFKDINEAILERNKLLQSSGAAGTSPSRVKEISSHRFCRMDSRGGLTDSFSEGTKELSFLKLTGETSTLKETFATDMVLEAEEHMDTESVIEPEVDMPEMIEEQEIKQIEIKTTGTDSHSDFLQLIRQLEDDTDLENEELITRYKRILQEEEEEANDNEKDKGKSN